MSPSQVEDRIVSGLNQIQEENVSTCFGPIIIAIAYKTTSGDTFWTGKWMVYDPTLLVKAQTETPYLDSVTDLPESFQTLFAPYFQKHDDGYLVYLGAGSVISGANALILGGSDITLTIPRITWWNKDTSNIQSIEIYASKPQIYIDTSVILDGDSDIYCVSNQLTPGSPLMTWCCVLPQKKYAEMELGGQLLYHQASVPLEDVSAAAKSIPLSFGGNIQVTEETLEVDAGTTRRFGEVMAYNARFHFFNSWRRTEIGVPSISKSQPGYHVVNLYYFVTYQEDDMTEGVERYVGYESVYASDATNAAQLVIAPSLNIKEVVTFYPTNEAMTSGYIHKYKMVPSTSYNYSICVDGGYSHTGTMSHYAALISAGKKNIISNQELNAINVTEQYDPFVFLVEHSYLAPGNVLDITPQMAYDRDNSYGQYPLNVFTDRGLYALMQGSSNVLYGAFFPLSNDVSVSNSISTEMGTFFLAAGALWLVAGSHVTLISDALSLGPHTYIRSCTGFQQLSQTQNVSGTTYSVSGYQSTVPFKDYVYKETTSSGTTTISKARLSYNRYNEELYISNPDYNYTYCLSIKHRQWFKIAGKIWQDVPGATIANQPGAAPTIINVVDFGLAPGETHTLVHLQSRPFSFVSQYTHVHRIVTMIRSELGFKEASPYTPDTIIVALYGSDNLQDWNLLTYSQRSGTVTTTTVDEQTVTTRTPLKVSQVRTPSAARSWRYYTLCIGGRVQTDTDLGPTLVDYDNVIRRIG